jgi:hypothetical protein
VTSNPNKQIHQPAHTNLNERYDSERVYNISSVLSIQKANESSIQRVISDIQLMRLKGSNRAQLNVDSIDNSDDENENEFNTNNKYGSIK